MVPRLRLYNPIIVDRALAGLAIAAAAAGGTAIASGNGKFSLLAFAVAALASAAILFSIPVTALFALWLFAAPILAGYTGAIGHTLFRFLYIALPLLLIIRAPREATRIDRIIWTDALPAVYVAFALISARYLSSVPNSTSLRYVYVTTGIGVFAYYFLAFSRYGTAFRVLVIAMIIWSGAVVAAATLVEGLTGWNLWHVTVSDVYVRRHVGTMSNPAATGTFLGVASAFAAAVLIWRGPRQLRTPSIVLLLLGLPALFMTYTRGPMVAAAIGGCALLAAASRVRFPAIVVLVAIAVGIAASWDQIASSSLYRHRLGVTSTLQYRAKVQDASIKLIERKPLIGWGYDTFDTAKSASGLLPPDPPLSDEQKRSNTVTSHDTFLTVLAETGLVGLLLLVIPWVVISWRAVGIARARPDLRWLVGGSVGAVFVYAISAAAFDTRFFSYLQALPWIAVGILRGQLSDTEP